MANFDDKAKAKLIIQLASLVALVGLAYIDASSTEFTVNQFVYAIIAGILFGVGSVRELLQGIAKGEDEDDKKKK